MELRAGDASVGHAVPELEPGVREENDNIPKISKMQIELMVNAFAADFNRIATLQFTNSVGQAKMRWIGIDEGHHRQRAIEEPGANAGLRGDFEDAAADTERLSGYPNLSVEEEQQMNEAFEQVVGA